VSTIAVIVPTVHRAEALAPLVDNIHEATANEHRIYLVMEHDDDASIAAAADLDACSVIGDYGSVTIAMNAGYAASVEPFAVLVNDDVTFMAGWDAYALAYFSKRVHIVGVNDGMGDTKSFIVVRRAFIEEFSGVFDAPNLIFHPGYVSQGPDTELAFYAMLRGVWADAPDAVIEHRNWRNGGDAEHPNYLKARKAVLTDLDTYNRRWPLWDPEQRMPPAIPTVPSI
jgi:hypothetical protein